MFFLWLEIAMLVLAVLAVMACIVVLVHDDEEIMSWFRTHYAATEAWTKQLIVRYKHSGRHTPRFVAALPEQEHRWYLQSLVFSAT